MIAQDILDLPSSAVLKAGWRNYIRLETVINNANSNLPPLVVSYARGRQMLICLFLSEQQHVASSRESVLQPLTLS